MGGKRRSSFEVYIDMLRVVARYNPSGIGPTHLMYEANLSWDSLVEKLSHLEKQKLIKIKPGEGSRKIITITQKGRGVLSRRVLRSIDEGMKALGF